MYKKVTRNGSSLQVNNSYEGITVEERIRLMVDNKEPITDSAPLIYTERKDGVRPEFDIRTDRFELAVDKMDAVAKAIRAKRDGIGEKPIGEQAKEGMDKENDGKPEPIQGTE